MNTPRVARAWTGVLLALLTACEQDDLPTDASAPRFSIGAADILVSTTADDGPGSLRQAIADVPDGGVIGFEAAIAGGTISLADRLLIQGKSLTIEGPADRGITLDGDGVAGIFFVSADGGLTLRNATITGSYDRLGAIWTSGTVRVENSTISGNHSVEQGSSGDGYGGGLEHAGGDITLVNSTISGNIADQEGGGIASPFANSGSITLIHSTVTGNSAPDDQAGGIFIRESGVQLVLQNTIVAGNSALTLPNCHIFSSQSAAYLGTNLLGDSDCLPRAEDIVAADPGTGPLADNGGPTRTHALLAGSPAIEAAAQACATVPVDQRYIARPQGNACDIGAFEFTGFVTPPLAVDPGGTISPTGVAIVSGTITCPAPATVAIGVTLRQSQKVGKVNTTVEASAETTVACGGTRPWSVALAPATGGFRNGNGTVTAETTAGPAYMLAAETSRTVKLVWGRK